MNKPAERKNRVLFIYADDQYEISSKTRRLLSKQNQETIVGALLRPQDHGKICAFAAREEIRTADFTLLPTKYVRFDDRKSSLVVMLNGSSWIRCLL